MQESSKQDKKVQDKAALEAKNKSAKQENEAAKPEAQTKALAAEAKDLIAQADDMHKQSETERKEAQAKAEEKTAKPASIENTKDEAVQEAADPAMNPPKKDSAAKVDPTAEAAAPVSQSTAAAAPSAPQVIERVEVKRGGVGLTIFCVLLAAAIAGVGFYGYQELQTLKAGQQSLQQANSAVASAQQSIADANGKIAALMQLNDRLVAQNNGLSEQNQALKLQIDELAQKQGQANEAVSAVYERLDRYEARDPNEWRVAEAYFNVAEGYRLAVFGANIKAAIWNLQQADNLLVGLNDENVVAIRAAIAQDLSTLSAIPEIDSVGISLRLEQLYRDVDTLVLAGYSDPDKLAHAFDKSTEPTSSFADWKNNLINSAKEFGSRFVDIRRRGPDAAVDFLSPQHEVYLRENIKTRLLLAKSNLASGQGAQYVENLTDAERMIKTYFDEESTAVQAALGLLGTLKSQNVELTLPRALESLKLFDNLAKEHLKNIQG